MDETGLRPADPNVKHFAEKRRDGLIALGVATLIWMVPALAGIIILAAGAYVAFYQWRISRRRSERSEAA